MITVQISALIALCVITFRRAGKLDEPFAFLGFVLIISGISYFLLQTMTKWYIWSDDGLVTGAPLAKTRSYNWSDLKSVDYGLMTKLSRLDFGDKGGVTVQKSVGAGVLVEHAQRLLTER